MKVKMLQFQHHAIKVYKGCGVTVPCILVLGTRWKSLNKLQAPATSAPVEYLPVLTGYEVGWAPESVWMREQKD
jgi:hypothetical protein